MCDDKTKSSRITTEEEFPSPSRGYFSPKFRNIYSRNTSGKEIDHKIKSLFLDHSPSQVRGISMDKFSPKISQTNPEMGGSINENQEDCNVLYPRNKHKNRSALVCDDKTKSSRITGEEKSPSPSREYFSPKSISNTDAVKNIFSHQNISEKEVSEYFVNNTIVESSNPLSRRNSRKRFDFSKEMLDCGSRIQRGTESSFDSQKLKP